MRPSVHDSFHAAAVPDAWASFGEALPHLLWVEAGDGTIAYRNRAWSDYTGLDASCPAPWWEELCHAEDLDRLRESWMNAQRDNTGFEIEFRCRRRDGSFRWFVCRTSPAIDATAQVVTHWIGTLTDIHAQKVREGELARGIRRRDEFLATLAHELRSPLQAMRQAMDILQMPGVEPEVQAHMRSVVDAQFSQLSRFTDEMLDGNKVRWNAMTLVAEETTIAALVESAVVSVRPAVEERRHELHVRIADPRCLMMVDAGRVTQALVNLLSNAAKYSDPGGRIDFSASCNAGLAEFVVRDLGRGIDAEVLPRIFELFERGSEERTSGREGLGIGLALVRHVAELHGGTIDARSDGAGRGSCFTLRIPLVAPSRR